MKPLYFILLFSAFLLPAFSNSDERTWKFKNGKKFRAELVSVDEESREVELLIDDEKTVFYKIGRFSEPDIAWLYEWLNIKDELEGNIANAKGTVEHTMTVGNYETDLYTYYPSTYTESNAVEFPLMLLFHAGGKAKRYLYRHIEAAEETGFVTIALGQFRNTGDNTTQEEAFLERFKEVFTDIRENIVFDPEKVFMGGISGGAWKAYHYSAWVDYPWAGIYANGGWLGGPKFYDLDYADNMNVVMVNGNADHANRWVEPDAQVLGKHNCITSIISFEGGHHIPPSRTQTRAFKWLLNPDQYEN